MSDSGFYFQPGSMTWKINREQVLLFGGTRTLLMQIAHPLVAEAVYEHSTVFTAPVRRLLRTLHFTLALVYGTEAEVMHAARTINQGHLRAQGTVSETIGRYEAGSAYRALSPDLLLWVFATLVEGAVSSYERFVGPLTQGEKQAFHEDSKRLGALLGLRDAHIPPTYRSLIDYMNLMIGRNALVVGPKARKIASVVLGQTPFILRPISFIPSRLAIGLLPCAVREQYGYTFSPVESLALDLFSKSVRTLVPTLPPPLRYFPQYRRALRLAIERETAAA
jgi:uncharacterized protein (DUF2236 family)